MVMVEMALGESYIGLIWFWWSLMPFGVSVFDVEWCRNPSYSLGLGRMTISWPTWTPVLWSWQSTTGRSLGKRWPSLRTIKGTGPNDPEWWHSYETHAEFEMILKFKTIDLVYLICKYFFSRAERKIKITSHGNKADANDWFVYSTQWDWNPMHPNATYQLRRRNKRQCVLWLWLLAIPLASTAAWL